MTLRAPDDDRIPKDFEETWDQPKGIIGFLATIDNIPISIRYMVTSFMFFIFGGLLAALMRIQLMRPENDFVDAATYNQLFTMHGTTMMFLFVIPFIEAFANYMIPLVNGTRDLPFPRLTALSYWTYLFGGLFVYSSFLFGLAPDGGWFAYVPLNLKEYSPGLNMDFWDIGLSVAEVAALGAASEMIVGILRMRSPGMSINRLPLFSWAMLVTSAMIIFGFTPLVVGTFMLELDRKGMTRFFDPGQGGDPLLWQHVFWFFGHPEVYIMFVPAVGILSHVVQTFSRRPVMSYTLMVLALIATGFLSFGLWAHHMYATGLSAVALGVFAAAGAVVAIPSGINVFGWIATIWAGKPVWRTPLLFTVAAIIVFTVGGVTGVMVASVPFDFQAHDTYFIVAHLHYVLFGGSIFPLFAGLYYWFPKMTGKMLSEKLGIWSVALMFVGFNVAFGPMHLSGLEGMPRRVYTYPAGLGLETYNLVSTIGAYVLALGVLLTLINFVAALLGGAKAGNDPWKGDSLEWSQQSPPANAQFEWLPVVRSRHPMWDQATLRPVEGDDPEIVRAVRALDGKPERWRGSLIVGVADGRPIALAHLPRRSLAPFIVSVGFLLLFTAALLENGPLAWLGLAVTAAGLVWWFWPIDTETFAIREMQAQRDDRGPGGVEEPSDGAATPYRMPLAVGDRASNGYWGTWVLLAILATASGTFLAGYFYLGEGTQPRPIGYAPPPLTAALLATFAALVAAAATRWMVRGVDRHDLKARRIGTVVALVAQAALLALSIVAWGDMGLDPAHDGYASGVLGVLLMHWIIATGAVVMLGAATTWLLAAPGDPRGNGVALNSSLVSSFAAANWIVVLVTVFLYQRLG